MGPPSSRSSAFPCGRPSITSKRTTSPRPLSAQRCASVPPIIPAPMSAIFLRAIVPSLGLPDAAGASGLPRVDVQRVRTRVARRVVRALCNIHEAGGRQPHRERFHVVGIQVILAEAEALLAEVEVDLVETGLVPARIRRLRPAPGEVVLDLVHETARATCG